MIKVKPIRDHEQLDAVYQAAKANQEGIIDPTHYVEKDGEIVGAISVAVACSSWWMHTEKTGPRDSLATFQVLEALMEDRGIKSYLMPCEERSPFYKIMERVGFKKLLGSWSIFKKE